MKKIILPGFISLILYLFLGYFSSPVFAFLGLGEGGSVSSLDCRKLWEDLAGNRLTIVGTEQQGTPWEVSSEKQTAKKENADYCQVSGQQFDAADNEHELRNSFDIKISYFQGQDQVKSNIDTLKSGESVEVDAKNVFGDMYSMRTLNIGTYGDSHYLEDGNYARTVGKVGNCVVSLTQTWYAIAHQWSTQQEPDDPFPTEAGLMDGMLDSTKSGWQTLSDAKVVQQFCGGTGGLSQPKDEGNAEKKETTRQWYDRVFGPLLNRPDTPQVEKTPGQKLDDWVKDTFGEIDLEHIETGPELDRLPSFDKQPEVAVEKPTPGSPYSAGILKQEGNNRALIQYPGSKEFTEMKPGKIPLGSTIRSGNDKIYLYIEVIGTIILEPGSEFDIPEFAPPTGSWDLNKGTAELKKERPSEPSPQPGGSTEFVDIYVIGTHYWITHEPGKQTTVGVYEGQVEVKTRDGKTIMVSPNGDKPGVVVVSQKLSPVKLALGGLVLAGVLSGIFILFKKKICHKRTE